MGIETGGSAFPQITKHIKLGDATYTESEVGMTLRDYFAAKALAAMIGLENKDGHKRGAAGVPILSGYAYEYADAMIAQRSKA